MAEDIVVRYRAEVDEALKKIQAFADANTKVEKSTDKAGKSIDKTTKSVDALGKETQATAKQIKDSTKSIDDFGKKGDGAFKGLATSAKSFALGGAAALAAAFSVDAIVQFGKASIDAFLEAEKNAERLKFAITSIGGESEAAFERLIDQSERLQRITVFDDNSIQQAQAALSAFGLTANQIENLIPKLADFATVTGTDIVSAANKVGSALQGSGAAFERLGAQISSTNTPLENYNNLLQGLEKQSGSAEAAANTLSGSLEQQENKLNDLKEFIGSKLSPVFTGLKIVLFEATAALFGFNRELAKEKSDDENFSKLEKQYKDVAISIAKSGGDVSKVFSDAQSVASDRLKKAEQENKEISDKIQERLEQVSRSTKDNFNPSNDPIIKSFSNQIKLNDELIKQEKDRLKIIASITSSIIEQSRVLSTDQIKLKTTEELNKLLIENQKINDTIAQSNAALIKDELEARKKGAAEAAKLLKQNQDLLRKLQIENLQDERVQREIQFQDEVNAIQVQGKLRNELIKELRVKLNRDLQVLDEKQTQLERDEAKKRDQIVLDTIEFERIAKQKAADEEAARASQALEITRNNEIEALLKEELSVRETYAKSFEELELADLKVKQDAIRAEFGFTVDANNKIVILNQETTDKIKKLYESLGLVYKGVTEERVSDEEKALSQILQSTSQIFSELTNLYTEFTNAQIDEINREKEARLLSIEEGLKANDDNLAKRRISEQEAYKIEKKLLDDKIRAEETAAKKERELKKKAAIAEKANALVQIAIRTAVNIIEQPGPFGLLAALWLALGAAQAAVVVAQPIPYAKGTKKAKKGLARVGEEGEEIMYVPGGTKVLPNKQTNRYGEVLDAMFDNRFDQLYIKRKDIAPQLIKQKQIREVNSQKSFADNIAQSAMINPATGLTYFDMEAIRKKGTKLTDDTIDRLAEAITRKSSIDIYRR